MLTKRPLLQFRVLRDSGEIGCASRQHGAIGLSQQRLAQQQRGGRIAFLDHLVRVEHQDAARQSSDQRRKPCRKMLAARARLAEFGAQPRHLVAKRVESAGELLGDRAEGQEGRLKVGSVAALFVG